MTVRTFLLLFLFPGMLAAAPVRTEHVEAELVAARTAAEPGKPLQAALRLTMIPEWHTYWRNPGDSGQPTELTWKLPTGYKAGEIQWPAPARLPAGPLMNFGYEGEVFLLFDLWIPPNATSTTVNAKATWLVCNPEHCIPEEADLSLTIPAGAGSATQWSGAIERTRAGLPVKVDWKMQARKTEKGVELEIGAPHSLKQVQYFPFDQGKIHNAGKQDFDGTRLQIPKAPQPVGAFNRVAGLLVGGPQPVEIDVPVVGGAVAGVGPGLVVALLFAFAGGLILNLMPCVLPVLSIKILGFAGQGNPREMRLHGALYALGVLASFWLLAALLLALKAAGQEIGWGFQLQSPVFVALLAVLFLVIALNLSGLFEFSSVPGVGNLQAKSKRSDAFLTGVLAVAVASPCTAPFMGAALGYALAEDAVSALGVFTALGAGMAIPYVALAWRPGWLKLLPKPGGWMNTFKKVLAVPLYATVVWLGWVFAMQVFVHGKPGEHWEQYSEARLNALNQQGKPVFVDFTAAWCVTCQVNKQTVLGRADTEQLFRDKGVVLLRADWTRRDAEITRALAALGRNGVPVYVLYSPGREAVLLPEILTRGAIVAALEPLDRRDPLRKEP